ncbi:hypothetical protein [Salinicola peritrichatus]|uniref:hypothetical protein n=1 Tax=Salinicola peritrichatus TaxID=1267424 RepID=UPI000DA1D0B4|nr:hypothetical protein [Salinicola peritrichatus]
MLTVLMLFLIFAGVAIAVYQVYDIYYDQNFGDDERRPETAAAEADGADAYASARSASWMQRFEALLGSDIDRRVVQAALAGNDTAAMVEPLRRRKRRLVCNGKIQIRHLPFWKTSPPRRDLRPALLIAVLVNCLLVLFLGGLSLYTIAYEVPGQAFAWTNSKFVLMVMIYTLIVLTYLISRFDRYMHDLYQIGKLNRYLGA